ncbi:phenylacetic acid degradation protein [Acidovorax sp. SRB_14]|uniref:PaaI family thioesterase n=1 Tax=unclassified Acidovorax TaxID=2684926 RepID=UPI00145DF203|nr:MULTISPECIES: PaaI family thioesterase [unclassified Acidovorax]NMM77954.1 phenylacetic acid degradation protein [Acidovorax sp. SRB_24]NMM80334.1 phenylacetic acid degradation protein [Acidovorax sp. SRB_14]NMM86866.1 phenylacetic acid degradation protein [Rhodococcus sp. SRB_17]
MSPFEPRNSHYAQRVHESFSCQGAMQTLGARLDHVAPGAVDIALDWSPTLTQQHGFLHAGMLSAALDSACGYAAFTLMAPEAEVLTIEFKINLLAPAQGERFRMEGRVLRPGRTITVCEGRAYALSTGAEKLVATMACTLMAVAGREGVRD